MRQDQRAWIIVKRINGLPTEKPMLDQPWTIRIVFANTGKTFAKNVQTSCMVEPAKDEQSITHKPIPAGSPGLISPNGENYSTLHPVHGAGIVTQPILDSLSSKSQTIYVLGVATYEDVFHEQHWLRFCEFLDWDEGAWEDCKRFGTNDTGEGKLPQ